ncbi:hypothetical protein Tco_0550014, partial [Tanacetum coccineum]
SSIPPECWAGNECHHSASAPGTGDPMENVIAAGGRGLYGGATVVKHAIANNIAAMA